MCLTEKDKRVIITPISLSAQQKKDAKYRVKTKIQKILQDMQFIKENHDVIYQEFGIDVLQNDIAVSEITESKDMSQKIKENKSPDPDLL